MGKTIELSDQHYAIMAEAAAERGESPDALMTHWLRDLASGSAPRRHHLERDHQNDLAVRAGSLSGGADRADLLHLPGQRALGLDASDVAQHRHLRQHGGSSMGPKVEAACDFASSTGKVAVIGALGEVAELIRGQKGTRITG
jgi:hypothetical protein